MTSGKTNSSRPWTLARKKAFIISVLRKGTKTWPPKYLAIKNAQDVKKINSKTGRMAMHYLCTMCGVSYPLKEVQVDHIKPVIDPAVGFTTWDSFITNLFCDPDNLQLLCKPCHKLKTKEENAKAIRTP